MSACLARLSSVAFESVSSAHAFLVKVRHLILTSFDDIDCMILEALVYGVLLEALKVRIRLCPWNELLASDQWPRHVAVLLSKHIGPST